MRGFVIIICVISYFNTIAQGPIEFSAFEGYAYDLPRRLIRSGLTYKDQITEFDTLARVSFHNIHIPETNSKNAFPQLKQSEALGLILYGEVTIRKDACYEFSLNSDDGSILWIDNQIIVNNDGDHKMLMVKDTVYLKKGVYPTKLWYFQGFPNKYGLVLDYEMLSDTVICDRRLTHQKADVILLESELYFNTGEAQVSRHIVEKINLALKEYSSIDSLVLEGRTDNIGSRRENKILSQKRIDSITQILSSIYPQHNYIILEKALGEDFPIADNSTNEGRSKNRSVIIKIYGLKNP